MKWAFCRIDSTRDVILKIHPTREDAEKQRQSANREAPRGSMPKLMYVVRQVSSNAVIGDRLRR